MNVGRVCATSNISNRVCAFFAAKFFDGLLLPSSYLSNVLSVDYF